MRIARALLAAATLMFLYACGGDDDDGGAPPANRPPSFTSSATANVAENAAGTVYTATASDPDGNALTYSISGGADAARFAITPAGALSFASPPDFEAPTDANRDNVYEVTLSVSDGRDSATLALRITVTDSVAGAFRVRRLATGLAQPLFLTALSGVSDRLLFVERAGRVRILVPSTGEVLPTPFLNVTADVATDGERGLLGLALAPDYATSRRAYVFLTNGGGDIELRRYTAFSTNAAQLDPASADVLLRVPHPRSNHNGGWIAFGPDGFLYVAMGDGGGANDPDGNGQNKATLYGKMLRLDVGRDDFPGDSERDYGIPATNPYATGGGAPEVWLYGLRNPFRNSFDRATGNLWVADVGQGAVEEINLLRPNDGGLNMGWPLYEGTRPNASGDPTGLTMPVTQYDHGSGPLQGSSITGGYVYRGPIESLQGLYIFADFVSGNIWSVPVSDLAQGTTAPSSRFTNRNAAFAPDAGTLSNIASFGEDQNGNLYIISISGSIWIIEPSS